MGARALGEDIQNQTGTIQHATFERSLEVALLARRQGVIEDHQLGLAILDEVMQLLDLATADQELGGRLMPGDINEANRLGACRARQLLEFLRVLARRGVLAVQMHQDSPLTTTGTFEEQRNLPQSLLDSDCSASPAVGRRTGRPGTTVEMACL